MSRLIVRIVGSSRELEAALAADEPVGSLLPNIVWMCEGSTPSAADASRDWELLTEAGVRLPSAGTLQAQGLSEGAVLRLRRVSEVALAPVRDGSVAQLPQAVPLGERLKAVAGVLVSAPAEPGPQGGDDDPGSLDRLTVTRPASTIQRVQQVWESTDYRKRLDSAIGTPRLTRCATIAVLSPKGGVGKTTTTVMLASLLSMLRSDRVVAVDNDPDYGTLGRSFSPEQPMFIDDLAEVLDQPALTATMLDRCLARGSHGMMVLPAPVDPARMEGVLDKEVYLRVLGRLKQMVGTLVLDCGAGMHSPATKAALEMADQLVLVSDADPVTASLVADVAARLSRQARYLVVVNRVPRRGGRLNLKHLSEDVPGASALIEIESAPDAAASVGLGRFDWATAPESWQLSGRELAAHLTAQWPGLGLSG